MAIPWKVALVEDDARLARAVTSALREEGYRVRGARTANEALALVGEWNPDLVLLDLMLPDNEGPELFTRFREVSSAALVGITARAMLSDIVAGLHAGADDYVVKPFAVEELVARINAVLRRSRSRGQSRMELGPLVVDVESGIASFGEQRLDLTATEFRILALLTREADAVVSQEQIVEQLWPAGGGPASNAVEVHLARLRRKLEAAGGVEFLQTVRGMGYRLRLEGRGG
jgi:DNA-binding response OmpR family regulator